MKIHLMKRFLVVLLWALLLMPHGLAAQQPQGAQPTNKKQEQPPPTVPGLADLISLETKLSARLAVLQKKIGTEFGASKVEQGLSGIDTKLAEYSRELENLKASPRYTYDQLLVIREKIEQKKRNFDYYDPLTTGDSSLSLGIQSILAFEVGYIEKTLEYARYSVLMDLYDVGGNLADGCNIAYMGATWMILVNGFAGMRDYDGQISFYPQRLDGQLKFSLQVKGQVLEVDILRDKATFTLKEGENLTISHENEEVLLTRATPRVVRDVADKRA